MEQGQMSNGTAVQAAVVLIKINSTHGFKAEQFSIPTPSNAAILHSIIFAREKNHAQYKYPNFEISLTPIVSQLFLKPEHETHIYI